MGKDGVGEPAPKKLKQSRLCFLKSPKAGGNLKSKLCSAVTGPRSPKSRLKCETATANHQPDRASVGGAETGASELRDGTGLETVDSVRSGANPNGCRPMEVDGGAAVDNGSEPDKETIDTEKVDVTVPNIVAESDASEINCESKPTATKRSDESKSTVCNNTGNESSVPNNTDESETGGPKITDGSKSTTPGCNDESYVSRNTDESKSTSKSTNDESDSSTDETESSDDPSKDESTDADSKAETSSRSRCAGVASTGKDEGSGGADASTASLNETGSSCKSPTSLSSESEDLPESKSSASAPVTPKTERKMTPKMLKRHEESLKKKELQQRLKQEKRAEKEEMRNKRLKERRDEKERNKQLKADKKKKRLAELELKNEEKRQKKEDKKQRREREEEERKRRRELRAEELRKEGERKERTQTAFVSFFKMPAPSSLSSPATSSLCPTGGEASTASSQNSPNFMPFPVKNDMRLAAIKRRQLSDEERERLDCALKDGHAVRSDCDTYMGCLRDGRHAPRASLSTWPAPVSDDVHDCIIIEAQVDEVESGDKGGEGGAGCGKPATRRAKLLQFCENRRPAYFGTWSKASSVVSGRKPFAKDNKGVLDYEVDSDSDWEEEGEGEDLENAAEDDNEEKEGEVEDGENGYLLDNTFVPHGYLSDDEQPDEEQAHQSVEKQKDRLVALKEEFDEEMKQGGAQALKPKLLGCLWVSNSTTQVSKGSLYEALLNHRAIWDESIGDGCISTEPPSVPVCAENKSPAQASSSKKIPPLVLQEIANMVDGSRWPLVKLVKEISEVLSVARPQNPVSRAALTRAIKQMAAKTVDPKENSVWVVKPEFRSEYKLEDLDLTPSQLTPTPKGKVKDTLLDNFLRGHRVQDASAAPPPAKKRISLTPLPTTTAPPAVGTMEGGGGGGGGGTTDASVKTKKKVAFVTLAPRTRTPGSSPRDRSLPCTPVPWPGSGERRGCLKPHTDTPRPPTNRFLSDTTTDVVNLVSDESS